MVQPHIIYGLLYTSVLYTGTNVEKIGPKFTAKEFSRGSYFGAFLRSFSFLDQSFSDVKFTSDALASSFQVQTNTRSACTFCTCTRQYARTKYSLFE